MVLALAVTVRVAARSPSDHDWNAHRFLLRVCGDGALIVLADPSMTVRPERRGGLPPLSPSLRPEGLVAIESVTVRGSRRSFWTSLRPPASVAVSSSSRYDGYS